MAHRHLEALGGDGGLQMDTNQFSELSKDTETGHMSWHTWCFGRQKSARTPCSGSRKEQMEEMNGVWHIHLYPTLTAQSWGSNKHFLISGSYGQFLFWLLLHYLPRHLCQLEQRPHTLPLLSEIIWTWRVGYRLGDIFSFIQRFWWLSYSLGHSYHLFWRLWNT